MAYDSEVAVVTGSANGIGRACAFRLAKNGFNAFLLDRDEENLRDAVREIDQVGGRAGYAVVDLTDRKAVEATFAEIVQSRGAIGVLVNNVGQSARERASEFWCSEPDLWDFMIDISLKTTLICSRQVVPGMRERKSGRIINIASEAALIGSKKATAYAAAKSGVLGFTRSLARELASFQVTVNAVAPGYTRTRALAMLPQDLVEAAISEIPLGFVGEPEDIAHAVAFFASNESRYVTGQTLLVNGGRWLN